MPEPENPKRKRFQLPDRPVDWFLMTFGYVYTILLAGLVGALVLGFLDHQVRQWIWLAMAGFAAIGVPLGWVKAGEPRSRSSSEVDASNPTQWFQAQLLTQTMFYIGKPPSKHVTPGQPDPRTVGVLQSCFILTILGLFGGLVFFFLVITVWCSLALSPFTPDSWRAHMQVDSMGASFSSSVPWIILGISIATFMVLGSVLGFVLCLCGRVWKERQE